MLWAEPSGAYTRIPGSPLTGPMRRSARLRFGHLSHNGRMNAVVWKSEAGRARLEEWYTRFASRIPVPVASHEVATRHGKGHVLIGGPEGAPTIVCLHAMRTGAAHLLSEFGPLMERFRLVAPDQPGQSVRGPQVKLPLTDLAYADWLRDVLDALHLQRPHLVGVSWGGFVARQFASASPDRVHSLSLLVPAGIVNGSTWRGLTRMAWPMVRYRLSPTDEHARQLLEPLVTTPDEHWIRFMADSMQDMVFDMRIPPLASDDDLRRLTMPTLVLGGDDDISFPGEPMVARMRALVPGVDAEVVRGCKHCPPTTETFRRWFAQRIGDHVAAAPARGTA